MKKLIFTLLFFIYTTFTFSISNCVSNKKADKADCTVFVILNSTDCNNCMKHGYAIISQLLEQYNDSQHVIFLMTEKRQESMNNEKEELSNLLDIKKVTLLWNDDLVSKIRKSARAENGLSSIAVYNNKENKFVYTSALKSILSFQELALHIK